MSFSDSDWTRDPPLPRTPAAARQRRTVMLAIAIATSCFALALFVYGVQEWLDASAHSESVERLRGTIESTTTAPTAAAPPTEPPTATPALTPPTPRPLVAPMALPSAAPAAASGAAVATEAADARQMATLEAEMKQRARETAAQAATEVARRKERAWQRFFRRPAFCDDNPSSAQLIECANQHIRARREFEERWDAGRL